jgi:Transposase DDE domain group 1
MPSYLLKRPVGRPPQEVRRYYSSFSYRAGSWSMPRRVVAKVEWHPGELYPRVGFIVTNLARPAERVVAFYNHRGTCEQWIKEGKGAIRWTRLSCRTFAANAVRLQLHALAYNLANFMRTLAMPKAAEPWSLTSLREKLIKIGARVVSHGRYVTCQLAEVAVSRQMFKDILMLIARLRAPPAPAWGRRGRCDKRRQPRCALITEQRRFRRDAAKRHAVLTLSGSTTLEFPCSAPRRDGRSR